MDLFLINLVLIILDVLVVFGFIYSFVKAWKYRPKFHIFTRPKKKTLTLRDAILKERWMHITRAVDYGSRDSMRLAVIDADKMADDILKRLGFGGEHMADRLMQMNQDDFSSLKRLWDAHRFRNNLVHEISTPFSEEKIRGILNDYQAFFKEVGIL